MLTRDWEQPNSNDKDGRDHDEDDDNDDDEAGVDAVPGTAVPFEYFYLAGKDRRVRSKDEADVTFHGRRA